MTTPPAEQSKLLTRRATADDAAAIRDIYNLEVTTSIVTFDLVPRSLEDQRRWLSDRSGAHAVIVAEEMVDPGNGTGARPVIVGYAALYAGRTR